MAKKWFGKKDEQADETLNDNIDNLGDADDQSEEILEYSSDQSEDEGESSEKQPITEGDNLDDTEDEEEDHEETGGSKKFVIGVVGKLTDRQRETIKASAKHISQFSKKLSYDEIEVVELSENEEENEGIYVDVKIDKNKEISKFAESGLGVSLASKCIPNDFQALLGSGKNRRATKKKRRK